MTATDKQPKFALVIHRMTDGGYLVMDSHVFEGGMPRMPLFASTTIDEALKYIHSQLEPSQ